MSKELNVNIQEVKAMVKEKGMTRDEIAEHYGISKKACREQIFSHPELKGIRKPQAKRGVVINLTGASDASAEETATAEETTEETETPNTDPATEAETTGSSTPHFSADEDTEETESEEEEEEAETEEDAEEETTEDAEEEAAKPSGGVEW